MKNAYFSKVMNLKPFAVLGLGLFSFCLAQAQESVHTSGGDASGAGGTVAFSIGQVVYTANTNITGAVGQGVQQPYDFFSVGINETELNLSVFPNPTAANIILQINDFEHVALNFELYDIQGKLLSNGHVTDLQTQIQTSNLATATYFLHILDENNKNVQTFKIIKIQ